MTDHPLARYGLVLGVCCIAGLAAGAVAGFVLATSQEGGWIAGAVVAVTAALAMIAGLWASVRWWRGLDEAAQEAHKWSWWWGATAGLCVAGVILLTLLHGSGGLGQGSVETALLAGVGLVVGCQIVGYALAWAAWWLKRR